MLVPGAAGDSHEAAMTAAGDEGITRIGAFLRKTRIDELPQIANTLKFAGIARDCSAPAASEWRSGPRTRVPRHVP